MAAQEESAAGMMVSRNGQNGMLGWLRENGYIVTFLVTQGAAIVIWGVRIDARVDVLERSQHDQDVIVSRLDERGSRSIPILEQRLKALEDSVASMQREMQTFNINSAKVPAVIQLQLDGMKEQQARIIQALDNTYNLLNDHLRNPGNERSRPIKP